MRDWQAPEGRVFGAASVRSVPKIVGLGAGSRVAAAARARTHVEIFQASGLFRDSAYAAMRSLIIPAVGAVYVYLKYRKRKLSLKVYHKIRFIKLKRKEKGLRYHKTVL